MAPLQGLGAGKLRVVLEIVPLQGLGGREIWDGRPVSCRAIDGSRDISFEISPFASLSRYDLGTSLVYMSRYDLGRYSVDMTAKCKHVYRFLYFTLSDRTGC